MLYIRFPLSLRNVEDLLPERGIEIDHETVRFWWNRFGPMFATKIGSSRVDRMSACHHWCWYLDEVQAKINGVTQCLWRAVDHEGEVLESFMTATRDRKAASGFLKKGIKCHRRPEVIVTDRLRSLVLRSRTLVVVMTARWDAGSTTGPRTRTFRSDDGSAPCCGSGACKRCRRSRRSMLRYTTAF